MKEKLRSIINSLRDIEQLPVCIQKDCEIDLCLKKISELGIDIVLRISGDIKYREFYINDQEQGFKVLVTIIQTSSYDMIIIDADFGDEE